jgi:hypothetical protein
VFQGSPSGLRFDLWLPVTSAVDLTEGGSNCANRPARLAIMVAFDVFAIRYCLWRESKKHRGVR